MGPILLLPVALASDCTLHRVAPADPHALSTTSGIPRNTLAVRTGPCSNGSLIEILATDPLYTDHSPKGSACVAAADLSPVDTLRWVVSAPWNRDDTGPFPQPPGMVLAPLPAAVPCSIEALTFGSERVERHRIGPLRPIEPDVLEAVLAIQAHAVQRFGPLALTDISWTHTGRVSLPWVHWYTDAELAEILAREHLQTEAQQDRAVRARGPTDHYLYFRGSDPIRSDIWGTPDTIHSLIDTLADWKATCPGDPVHCVVQLGDISWFSDKRPDPLGHRDHYGGTCIDIRLFRADGSRYEAWWNRPDDRPQFAQTAGYDGALNAAFVAHLRARPDVHRVLFNDPAAAGATPARGHDDHMHVCFEPPTRSPKSSATP